MGALLSPTSDNFVQKTLGAALLAGATTVTLNNVTNIPNLPGVFIVDRINSNDVETPSAREVITYTGVSGSTLTGLTRNADGSGSDQDHAINAIVEFGPDILWAQSIYDALSTVITVANTSNVNTTNVVTPTGTQTLTNKILTSPVLTTPQINDTSADHQYVFAVSELAADRTVTLPLLLGNDVFVFADFIQTLTNKRITPRIVTAADDATAVIDVDVTDQYQLTAVANATTFTTTGTPVNGQKLVIKLKDAGVGKGLTWDGVFRAVGVTLPTTTVASKTHYIGCIYNSADTKWDAVAVVQEA